MPLDQYTPDIDLSPFGEKKEDIELMVNDIRKKPTQIDALSALDSYKDSSINSLMPQSQRQESFYNEGFEIGNAYERLSDGTYIPKYENFQQGTDNEDRLAQTQSGWEKSRNGVAKFVGKTATATAGGVVGSIYGLGDAVVKGDWTAIYDNDFYDVMDDWNKQMDNGLSNYYAKQERDNNFGQSLMTTNFWANDFLGGLSFTAGAIASEAILAAATGGSSLVVGAARTAMRATEALKGIKYAKGASKILTNHLSKARAVKNATIAGKAASAANTARYMYTSAGYEAGLEARMFKQEQEATFNQHFKDLGEDPSDEQVANFYSELDEKTNAVFATNVGLVGSSNLLVFGKMFNISNPLTSVSNGAKKTLFGQGIKLVDGVLTPIKKNTAQRVAGTAYSVLKAPVTEGIYEEGGQSVTSNAAAKMMESMYDTDEDSLAMMEAVYEGMAETYGTKEGWKEVGLGMLIGAFGGSAATGLQGGNPFTEVSEAASKISKRDQKRVFDYQDKGVNSQEAARMALGIYGNEPVKKLAAEIYRNSALSKSGKQMKKASVKGDIFLHEQGRLSGLMANVIYAENTGLSEESQEQLFNDIDNTPDSELAGMIGIEAPTEDQIKELKESAKADYLKIKKDFKANKEFANYMIGEISKKDYDKTGLGTETLRTMLAYQKTMADRTMDFAKELNTDIIKQVETFDQENFQKLQEVGRTKMALDMATPRRAADYRNTNKRLNRAQKKIEALNKQLIKQESILTNTEGDNISNAQTKLKTAQRITEERELADSLRLERDLLLKTIKVRANMPTDAGDLFISENLDNLEESLKEIDGLVENVKQRDPEKYVRLKSAIAAYQKSVNGSKQMSEIFEDLMNGETQLKGATRTFLNKSKEFNDPTQRLIDNLTKVQQGFFQEAKQRDAIRGVITPKEGDQRDTEGDLETEPTETEQAPAPTTLQNLDKAINEIWKKGGALIENPTDPEAARPTEEDYDRYFSLMSQAKVPTDNVLGKNYERASKKVLDKIGLSREDIKEFQNLSNRLSEWQLVSSLGENVTLKDLMDQKAALQKDVSTSTTQPMEEQDKVDMIMRATREAASKSMNSKEINNADSVMVQKTEDGKYNIANLRLEDFDPEISRVAESEATENESGTLVFSKDGQEFAVGTTITGRYIFESEEEFDKFLDFFGLKALSYKGQVSTWSAIYSKNEEGYEMLDSTFETTQVDSTDNILEPQKLFDLKEGDELGFKVSLRDSYNTKLINRYLRGEIDKTYLLNQVKVYVTNSKGELVGELKGKNGYTQHTEGTLTLRQEAQEFILSEIDRIENEPQFEENGEESGFMYTTQKGTRATTNPIQEITLPYGTTVTQVYNGTPNVKLNEDGSVQEQEIPEGSITSFGIYKSGEILLNPNSQDSAEDVDTHFLRALGDAPIIVVKNGNKKIAYPAQVKGQGNTLTQEVEDVLDSELSAVEQITSIIGLLADNGVDPRAYNLRYISSDNNSFDDGTVEQVIKDLQGKEKFVSESEFLAEDYGFSNLYQMATTTLNLSDRPFRNPKIAMDAEGITLNREQQDRNTKTQIDLTGKISTSKIDSLAKAIAFSKEVDNDSEVEDFARDNNGGTLEVKNADFNGNKALVYQTNKADDWSGEGSSFRKTWDVLKFNQGQYYAHARILLTADQKNEYSQDKKAPFAEKLKKLARDNRNEGNVILIDVRPKTKSNKNPISTADRQVYERFKEIIDKRAEELLSLSSQKQAQSNSNQNENC